MTRWFRPFPLILLSGLLCSPNLASAADKIKISTLKAVGGAPFYIAQEKGLFAEEGLDAEVVFTDQPQLPAQGTLAGDFDFGLVTLTAGFFNSAGQGALRIIAGSSDEARSFQAFAIAVSHQAYAAGLTNLRSFAGHSFGTAGLGAPPQFAVALLADKYSFDYGSLKIIQLGGLPNIASALIGGTIDSAIISGSYVKPAIQKGDIINLGWLGDETRLPIAAIATSANLADRRGDLVGRFLRAYKIGAHAYIDAVTNKKTGERQDGPTAPEIYAILAKHLGQPIDIIKAGVSHIDADGRVDVANIRREIEWYKSQGYVKHEVDLASIIDARYAVPLPEN
jgi:NitT/TauT family transport system substrate-binding protein